MCQAAEQIIGAAPRADRNGGAGPRAGVGRMRRCEKRRRVPESPRLTGGHSIGDEMRKEGVNRALDDGARDALGAHAALLHRQVERGDRDTVKSHHCECRRVASWNDKVANWRPEINIDVDDVNGFKLPSHAGGGQAEVLAV